MKENAWDDWDKATYHHIVNNLDLTGYYCKIYVIPCYHYFRTSLCLAEFFIKMRKKMSFILRKNIIFLCQSSSCTVYSRLPPVNHTNQRFGFFFNMWPFCKIFFIVTITASINLLNTSAFPVFSKPVGLMTPKRLRVAETPVISLLVEIPMSSVQYAKPLDVRTGGKFYLETPMEHYAYSSAGRSNLHRVNIKYLMQSMYRANLMCFFLHFWSMKDSSVPWDAPHARITPPPWSRKRVPK